MATSNPEEISEGEKRVMSAIDKLNQRLDALEKSKDDKADLKKDAKDLKEAINKDEIKGLSEETGNAIIQKLDTILGKLGDNKPAKKSFF